MCDYILTSFTELDDSQFNYSDYSVGGSGAIEWFHPSYAVFENPLNIIAPDNYKPRELPTPMEAKKEDPKLFFFINNFAKALRIVDFWLEHSDSGMSSRTGDAVEDWISTCCKLLSYFRLNNSWPVPAFLPWYKSNIARSTPIFLTFIERELNLPYAIARNAIPNAVYHWQELVNDWTKLTTEKFLPFNAPFPKCSALRGFLYEINLWDSLGTSPRMDRLQIKLRDDYITFIQTSGYIERYERYADPPTRPNY